MKNISLSKRDHIRPKKKFWQALLLTLLVCCTFIFAACKKEINYAEYISERRDNIFLCEDKDFSLRIYAVEKESPYTTDGVPRETAARTEVYLCAPSGDKTCNIAFTVNGQEYGGEMSFDNVKAEYYYGCTLDISELSEIVCRIVYGEEEKEFTARSVKTEATLSAEDILGKLREAETALFENMTDKYGFTGEIYLRLIYEDSPYYYVGIIDREGRTTAFLMNAETGKILAKRES